MTDIPRLYSCLRHPLASYDLSGYPLEARGHFRGGHGELMNDGA